MLCFADGYSNGSEGESSETLIAIAGAKVHTPEFRDNGQQMRIALNCAFPTETDLSKVKLLEDYSKEEAIKACVDKCLKE